MITGHIAIPIDVCISKLRAGVNLFDDQVSEEEAWMQLDKMKRAGRKYVSACDNTDASGMCICDVIENAPPNSDGA